MTAGSSWPPGSGNEVRRALSLVVCGAPLATRTTDLVAHLTAGGWSVSVVGTAASASWIDADAVITMLGSPVRLDHHAPGEPTRESRPDAVVVCPATFNTINKAAVGIADTYALGVLCEALGSDVPTCIVPMVNDRLWGHPAWADSLALLARAGTTFIDIRTGEPRATAVPAGTGDEVVSQFDPRWITSALALTG